jgi:hypothetical protein
VQLEFSPDVLIGGGRSRISWLIWGCPATVLSSDLYSSVGVDIRMLSCQVLPKQIEATPSEFTAIYTQPSFVHLSLVPCNSLRLCIFFAANIARVSASGSLSS